MERNRFYGILIPTIFLLLTAAVLDIMLGSVHIPLSEIPAILKDESAHANWQYIVREIRLPRLITAILAGAGLSVAGLMMQTLFRNPLAGPYVLGISSGASLGVAIFIMSAGVFSISVQTLMNSYLGQIMAAVLGALLVFLLILSIAGRVRDSVSLLIVGIMFGSLTTALVSILQYFSRPDQVQKFVVWTMGSLSATSWNQLGYLITFVLPGILLSVFLVKPMNALLLGENNARAAGVRVLRVRYMILISSGIIAGALTAFTGPIAFVGMAVPHLSRMILHSTNHRYVLPFTLLFGALLLVVCDIISQLPGSNMVLPINVITAIFGAPVVIWIIVGRKRLKSSF